MRDSANVVSSTEFPAFIGEIRDALAGGKLPESIKTASGLRLSASVHGDGDGTYVILNGFAPGAAGGMEPVSLEVAPGVSAPLSEFSIYLHNEEGGF
jgi:hypothetical protein